LVGGKRIGEDERRREREGGCGEREGGYGKAKGKDVW
jgi:hypothetical protein